jgi:hypothetical protein
MGTNMRNGEHTANPLNYPAAKQRGIAPKIPTRITLPTLRERGSFVYGM